MGSSDQEIHKGLTGVVVDRTSISMVNAATNSLTYRGYPVEDLTRYCAFDEVAFLLWHGELPSPDELAAQRAVERQHRRLDDTVVAALTELPVTAHPMDTVRTAISILGTHDPDEDDNSPEANQRKALRLFAAVPAIVALEQRRRRGQDPIPPRDDLGFSENFLYMTFGEVPDTAVVHAFETSLILYAEHSFNASTFTARVVTSTLSDIYSATTAAVGALKGPLHGGANEAVMRMFDEIGAAANVETWLEQALAERRTIMGFGHRVYKNGDSRVPTMRRALQDVATLRGEHELLEMYEKVAGEMLRRKRLHPNLDYPAGPTYHLIGIDTPIFTPIFVAARIPGWTAHVVEQLGANSLIRPLSAYVGRAQRPVPIT